MSQTGAKMALSVVPDAPQPDQQPLVSSKFDKKLLNAAAQKILDWLRDPKNKNKPNPPLGVRIFNFVYDIVTDPHYKNGTIIGIDELTGRTIYPLRAKSPKEQKTRLKAVMTALSAVYVAFNSDVNSKVCAIVPSYDEAGKKITGLTIPSEQNQIDTFRGKQQHKLAVAIENVEITDNALKMLTGNTAMRLKSGDDTK